MLEEEFEDLVREILETLPQAFARYLPTIAIVVEAAPSPLLLQHLGIGPGHTLRGLYQGVPLSKRGHFQTPHLPDSITIFQQSIESLAQTEEEIPGLVRETVLHELGHYFGLDHTRLQALLNEAEE